MRHGGGNLPGLRVRAYNAELRDANGFIGDRASKRGFQAILDDWRDRLHDEDPFGDVPASDIPRKKLDTILAEGDPETAGLVLAAVEEFAGELAHVTQRLLQTEDWAGTQRIAVGGGMRASRIGELAIGRAWVLLRALGIEVELRAIGRHPDEAGLIGAAHLIPREALADYDCMLAVDIGGTNFRAGLIELNHRQSPDLSAARVEAIQIWHHRNDAPSRDEAVERLCQMLKRLLNRKHRVAPVVGIGCPGLVTPDGRIERGAQNLPAGWEDADFRLPDRIAAQFPRLNDQAIQVVLHNDAVIQGLSEIPCMTDVTRWGVLTIGTGLGNASFENTR